ncbi:hypothetical protein A1O3_07522 [Capronia epimyces CBS 606.96]|uniref:protein-tyrosine-phosphatase n=1 Tax=Capronia epimyces CBS 606.96 TaxID=1182542 RepID=W9XL18_9EURO|nr:uncharacterized protein A1O3_07522 [Capronia epimyces CBS 606.96]EXJ81232.1 hypothetical protein A1O3_07522 [Capronia epimyces CBS 606.96]
MAELGSDTIHSESRIFITDAYTHPDSTGVSSQPLHHRNSVTSIMTASTESSPTTTNSTFDSPLITDPSPSSSPESASSSLPMLPFRNRMVKEPQLQSTECQETRPTSQTGTFNGHVGKAEVVVEATKNVKNLSLNMGGVILPRPATSHGFESSHTISAPSSPLKDTPRTGRRKPANLTIMTPGFQQQTFSRTIDVPPTPSSRPALHHIHSSPALASLASPGKPPPQGLFLPLPATGNVYSGPGSESSNSSQSAGGALPDLKEEDEFHPQRSQETQERGYPKGPVLVYDTGLYLYLEPTAEEASSFDTVINVAKEINCPLDLEASSPDIPEPQTAVSEMSFKSAWEWPMPHDVQTPTTPRQTAFSPRKQPEYLHIPWDHNSEILEDLYTLCRLIDERIQAGKRVLVHCQLGVSRSASLVIAYGLFKGYRPDFHSMYMTVKQRSEWVGPNMSLIYQLTDFRSKVVKGVYGDHSYNPSPNWWKMQRPDPPIMDTPIATQAQWRAIPHAIDLTRRPAGPSKADCPPTVKAWPPLRTNKVLPPVPLFPKNDEKETVTPVNSTQVLDKIPTQPPDPDATLTVTTPAESSSRPQSVSPRPLPFRERFDDGMEPIQLSPRASKTPRLGILTSSPQMDLALQEVPGSPVLFSPRAVEFMASSFGITSAGDLAVMDPVTKSGRGLLHSHQAMAPTALATTDQIPTAFDPRSPHQQGENAEIFRNIDGVL